MVRVLEYVYMYCREAAQPNLLAGRAKGAESASAARTSAQTRLARGFHAERARAFLKSFPTAFAPGTLQADMALLLLLSVILTIGIILITRSTNALDDDGWSLRHLGQRHEIPPLPVKELDRVP